MITLYPNEKILIVVRKHWFVLFSKFLIIFTMILAPLVISALLLSTGIINAEIISFVRFFVITYFLIVVLVSFLFWMDHYLDIWIITNTRIIDVEQDGLFKRETSEFGIDKIQDITVDVPNVVATFLRYGDLRIQTAGERSFTIKDIPNIYEVKKIIMDQVIKRENVGT